MITQARLKELLNYNPETGAFTWRKVGKPIQEGRLAVAARKSAERKYNYHSNHGRGV